MNHIATGRVLSLGGELLPPYHRRQQRRWRWRWSRWRWLGGNSLSWQNAGTETSVPQTSSSMAMALRNFSERSADSFRIFASERFYRQRGDVRGHQEAHTRWWRGQGWTRATRWCGHLLALLCLCFGLCLVSGKIETSGFVSSNFKNISCVTFLKHKNSRKQELTLWHLVNRLVPKNVKNSTKCKQNIKQLV
jgi:hypothetical protein